VRREGGDNESGQNKNGAKFWPVMQVVDLLYQSPHGNSAGLRTPIRQAHTHFAFIVDESGSA